MLGVNSINIALILVNSFIVNEFIDWINSYFYCLTFFILLFDNRSND